MTPALLAGAALVVVPIVLHLVMRQQPKRLEFPPLLLLKSRSHSNRRRLQLRHWLLLALRTLAILLLALALARPSIQGSGFLGGQEAPVAAALVFDTSPRMGYRQGSGGPTRLEAAQETASWLLAHLPTESEVAVIDCQTGPAAFAVDLGAARQRIGRLRAAHVPRSLPAMLEAALDLVTTSQLPRREVYLFTDLTRSAWETESGELLRQKLAQAEQVGLYVIDVGAEDPRNFALGELQLGQQIVPPHAPLTLSIDLIRSGPEERREVELFLLDETGQPRKRGHLDEEWREKENRQVEFRLGALDLGTHQGYIRIMGDDNLACDDTRYFTLEVRPPWRILVAASRAEDALFVTEALAPTMLREQGQARFECNLVDWEGLGRASLGQYAAVLLLDPGQLPPATWESLAAFARGGGGVGLFLGRRGTLAALNEPAPQSLLPGLLKRQWNEATYLAPDARGHHPLLAKFRSLAGSVPWREFPVYRYWQLGDLAAGSSPVVLYGSGHPAIVERGLGRGRVLTMTTPVSDPASDPDLWNLLPTGIEPWPFVMLSGEMGLYLVGSGQERLNYSAGETALIPLQNVPPDTSLLLLTTPSGDHLRETVDPRSGTLAITATEQPGNYRLRAGGGEAGRVDRGFSVNWAPQWTNLARLETSELLALLGEGRYHLAHDRREIDRDINIGRVGRELFPYLMVFLVVVLASEYLLANRFYRRQAA